MQLPFGMGITSLAAVSASYDAEDQLRQRILRITGERDYLSRRLRAMGVYTTDGDANFVYLPAVGRPWREVFGDTGLTARYYPDGAARITVGSRASTKRCWRQWQSGGLTKSRPVVRCKKKGAP